MVDQTQLKEMKTAVEVMDKTLHQIIVDGNVLPSEEDKVRAGKAYEQIYANRQEVAGQIAQLQNGESQAPLSSTSGTRTPAPKRKWLVFGVGIMGVVGVVSLLGYAIHRSMRGRSKGKRRKKK